MPKNLIGDIVSRIRTQVKAVKQDALLTNRDIYSFVIKHAKWLMKREDDRNKLLIFSSIIQSLDFVELEEVDKVEACCVGISSNCIIKRTKDKIPLFYQGYYGPLIKAVTSIDGSEELQCTSSSTYISISKSKNFKYNKAKYFWYLNEHLYFPDLDWDAVRIEGIFEDDISMYKCAPEEEKCLNRMESVFSVPDYLFGELESLVFKDLVGQLQVPSDPGNDKVSPLR